MLLKKGVLQSSTYHLHITLIRNNCLSDRYYFIGCFEKLQANKKLVMTQAFVTPMIQLVISDKFVLRNFILAMISQNYVFNLL